jgi:UPF0755 protein
MQGSTVFKRLFWIAAGVLIVIAAAMAIVVVNALYNPPDEGKGRTIRLTVQTGESFSHVTKRLAAEGLLDHPRIIDLYAVLVHHDRSMKSGTYKFTVGEKPASIIEKLLSGQVLKAVVTIPEGRNIWEIGGILSASAGIDSSAFVAFAGDSVNAAKFGIDAPSLEGYLFPDTYDIPWGMSVEETARMMVSKLHQVFEDGMKLRADSLGMNLKQVLTMASIIEAEARLPEERPMVSAVYYNRLRRGMKLEADPTVAYAKGGYIGRLFHEDLLIPACRPDPFVIRGRPRSRPRCFRIPRARLYILLRGEMEDIYFH